MTEPAIRIHSRRFARALFTLVFIIVSLRSASAAEASKIRFELPADQVRSSLTHHNHALNEYTGFLESRILRMIPRTNFLAQPHPRPVAHHGGGYFWDGYVSWYDDRTPVRGQYASYTNRPRDLWPDLNTVHVTASQGYGNDRLFLEFETYTPGFSHFEVTTDGGEWRAAEERRTWLLVPGRNVVQVRAVTKAGNRGKPARIVVNRVAAPLHEWKSQ